MSKEMTCGLFGILKYESVAAEDGSDEDLEFHVRQVLSHTSPAIYGGFCQIHPRAHTEVRTAETDLGPYENGLNVF